MCILFYYYVFISATCQEARAKLDRAIMQTDIESGVEDKSSRAKRKTKCLDSSDSDEDINDNMDEDFENKPWKKAKKMELVII